MTNKLTIDCISDLHGHFPTLQGGDLLLLAGDYIAGRTLKEWLLFFEWLKNQNYRKKIVVAGNHDNFLSDAFPKTQEEADRLAELRDFLDITEDFEYLCDSGLEFEGFKIWGSPWTKTFHGMNPRCKYFTLDTEEELYEKWAQIPKETDILITHSPAHSILDKVTDGYSVGSAALFTWLEHVDRPKLHVFGHIHESYGQAEAFSTYNDKMMISVNASHVNERYLPVNKPIRVILEGKVESQKEGS